MKSLLKYTLVAALALNAGSALANWKLNIDNSRINFISIKKSAIAENHYFKRFEGGIDKQGEVTINIDLTSVETIIPIRNERMQKMLFETNLYPAAKISAQAPLSDIKKMAIGESKAQVLNVGVELHGKKQTKPVDVIITKLANNKIVVSNTKSLIIQATEFDLTGGVEALRKIAGLSVIATSIPVNVHFEFVK